MSAPLRAPLFTVVTRWVLMSLRAMQPAPAPALRTDWVLALYSALLIVASADAVVRLVGVERHAMQCGHLLERVWVRGTWLGLGQGQGLGSLAGRVRAKANLESEDDGGLLLNLLLTQALAVVKLAHGAAASVPDGRRLRAVHSLRQLAPG